MVPKYSVYLGGQDVMIWKYGDQIGLVGHHLTMGTKFLGTICPWGQNWLGTVCPEGPINLGPIVGDQMSGDRMCSGPNVSQPEDSFFAFLCL